MMPARMTMRTEDIAGYLGVTMKCAQNMMHSEALKDKSYTLQDGKRAKLFIDVRSFAAYLSERDHSDPEQKRRDLIEYLRETDREKKRA